MAKFNNENKRFSSAPNALINDDTIPDRARFIYVYMNAKPEGWEFFHEPMAKALGMGVDTMKKYIDILVERGWLDRGPQQNENGKFGAIEYTLKAIRKKTSNKNTDTEKYRNGKIGQQYINSSINTPLNVDNSTMDSPVINKEEKRLSNDNQKKGDSSSRFIKPTIEQIEAYIKEKGYHFDAEHFWNYYESKGWKVGNSPMKNWKAACATWESKRKSENPDKSEETTDLPAGLTPEKWEQARNWFKTRVPRIAGSITPNDHLSMMALARWKRDVYIEILIKIEASDYTGSILEEFERISETEEYSQRLWGNE